MEKKITRSTIKSFIKNNFHGLYIKHKSAFNGMTDGVEEVKSEWSKIKKSGNAFNENYDLGVASAWFVGGSRDYFTPYADDVMVGYEVYNSCGSFILAFQK